MKDKLINGYKKLNDFDKDNLEEYNALKNMYYLDPNMDDKEALHILNICKEAWLKEEYNIHSLSDYSYFVTMGLCDGSLEYEELNKITKWDLIEAINENNIDIIKENISCRENIKL